MKILSLIHHPQGGCEYYRQVIPLNSIKHKIEKVQGVNFIGQMSDDEIKEYDVFHIIRKDMRGDIDRVKSLGLKVIFDTDDYWNIDSTHLLFDSYKRNNMVENVINCINKADLVTTTQSYLAQKIMQHNPKKLAVIPNCILPTETQFSETGATGSDKIRIGWVGGIHHIEDIKLLEIAFNKIWNDDRINQKIQVVLGGYQQNSDVYKYFAKILTGNHHPIAQENTILVEAMDVRNFAKMYDLCDIMLAPLTDSEFNRCKSNLKVVEAGWKGKMVVASHVHPYSQTIIHGENGMLISNKRAHKDWHKVIRDLVEKPVEIKRMSGNLQKDIRLNFDINKHAEHILQTYQSVLE